MCLYTKQVEPKIAEKDIVCYKFYRRYNEILISPYQEVAAPEIGVVTNTELGKSYEQPEEYSIFNPDFYGFNRVDKGFHSFKTLVGVKHEANRFERYYNLVIVKCIIPKGSLYYSGKFKKYKSYCSNSIKLVEVCV